MEETAKEQPLAKREKTFLPTSELTGNLTPSKKMGKIEKLLIILSLFPLSI